MPKNDNEQLVVKPSKWKNFKDTYFLVGSMIESSFITMRSPYWIIQALFDKSCGIYQFHLSGRTCSNPRNQNLYQTDT